MYHYQKFEIPNSWKWITLPEACLIPITDGTHQTPTYSDKDNGVPFLSSKDVTSRSIDWNNIKYITKSLHEELYKRIAPQKWDILLAKNGTTGVAAMVETDAIFDIYVTLALIRPALGYIHPKYLLYVINSNFCKEQFNTHLTGIGLPNLHLIDIQRTMIPLPPYKEQIRIADKLDEYLYIIDKVEEDVSSLALLVSNTKSKILELAMQGKLVPQNPTDEPATDILRRVNPKARIITDNPHYPQLPDNWALSTIKDVFIINPKNKVDNSTLAGFVPMASIDDGYSNSFTFVTKEWGAIKSGFTHFADGDIAVAKISPCLENRKSMVVKGLPNGIGSGTTELLVFRSDALIPEYGLLFFKSDNFIKKCVSTYNGVVGQQRVGKGIVEEIALPIPPVNEQKKIVGVVKYLFNVLENIRVSLD